LKLTPEIDMLERAAFALGSFKDKVVFLGGSVVGLLLTDPAAPSPRATGDVGVIVPVGSLIDYDSVRVKMEQLRFAQDMESSVICRWKGHGLIVDVMPTEGHVLGFSNQWYPSAMHCARRTSLPNGAKAVNPSPRKGLTTWVIS
jgi:hypothetical protein